MSYWLCADHPWSTCCSSLASEFMIRYDMTVVMVPTPATDKTSPTTLPSHPQQYIYTDIPFGAITTTSTATSLSAFFETD